MKSELLLIDNIFEEVRDRVVYIKFKHLTMSEYKPKIDLIKDKVVLVIDDILDEGLTLTDIKKNLIEMGAKQVVIAVLFDKKIDKIKPIKADFFGLEVPDAYVYGFGLDFNGIGRNIPHLYAHK